MASPPVIRSAARIKLPIGVDTFSELIEGSYTFVDKSLLIKDFIDVGAKVTLFTRPRRFGKTLNLSMLQYFFAPEVDGRPTAELFKNLAIAVHPDAMAHQGQYPVIFVTLKDMGGESFSDFEASLKGKLATMVKEHGELRNSPRILDSERQLLDALENRRADSAVMKDALRLLSELLYKHHGRKAVILLDEYDAAIHAAYQRGYYDELIRFLRPMMGAALKTNRYLHQAAVTGILKIGKESMFSDLNNLDVHTVLDEGYSPYFGFTEAEVAALLDETGLAAREPGLEGGIKDWYNGYRFGGHVLYNPWSIIKCLQLHGRLEPYWANTSGSDLLKKFMASADAEFKQDLERLMAGESVQEFIDPTLAFGSLGSDSTTLWSLMLFAGYLTALEVEPLGRQKRCRLTIPNREIRYEYDSIIQSWFSGPSETSYREMLRGLTRGDPKAFEAGLREYLLTSASVFDTGGRHPEKVYHVLVLGMMVGLKQSHAIASNRESGYGRSDLALIPKQPGGVGIVLEFKQTSEPEKLQAMAEAALAQIEVKRYDAELRQYPVKEILGIGLGFCGKEVALSYRSL